MLSAWVPLRVPRRSSAGLYLRPQRGRRYHVQMMGPHLGSGFLHEEVASLRATIAAIDIAEVFEAKRLTALSNVRRRGNSYGTIDDRFCVESGHRGAAYLLDIQHVAPNVLLKHASFLLERGALAGVVRDEPYGTHREADHPSTLEPGSGLVLRNLSVGRRIDGATSSSQSRATFCVIPT